MAIEKNNSQFGFTGRTGKLVTRIINGKRVVAARPRKYKRKSKYVKSNNNKFRYCGRLAKGVISIPVLKDIWELYSKGNSIAYRSIIHENMELATEAGLTLSDMIVPPSGNNLITDILLENNSANISIRLTPNLISTALENKFRIILLITGVNDSNKLDCMSDEYLFIPENDVETSQVNFKLNVEVPDFISYRKDILIFGTVTWNLKNSFELCWSSTFAKKI